ncbi:hypothetical protein [Streptomyces sp. NBC_01198]|uniref:hypothetical protein n=1 Tax=Streptomyces sp. NBC_01198 TaxID=2903769 RepID=UPI002E142DC0|nr:hypothetical protein OG702_34750 [Streptomyces sp. NBC_01198]
MDEEQQGGPERAGGDSDIDWQAERRWSDRPWVPFGVLVVGGALMTVATGRQWGVAAGAGVVAGWCAVMLLAVWQFARLRRDLAREARVQTRQIPVLQRRLQKERLPSDPPMRRAMAVLVRRQRRQIRRSRWIWPAYAGLCPVFGVVFLVAGETRLGVFWLILAVPTALSAFGFRRTRHRLDRLEARLAPDLAAVRSPVSGS